MRRQSPARALLRDRLRDLEQRAFTARRAAGLSRSRSAVIEKVNERRRRHRRGPLNPKTVGGWFQPHDPHVAPEFDDLWDLVEVYLGWTGEPADREHWRNLHAETRSARPDRSAGEPWADLVDGHTAWRRVTPGSDSTAFEQHVVRLAGRLADVRDEEERGLDGPWRDPGLAERYTRRVEFLLDRVLPEETSFSPAEVALLTLIPPLHHTRTLWSMARLSRVRPADLHPADLADPTDRCREKYQEFFSQYSWLVRRANQRDIPDREGARQEIGWWLFLRWLEQPAALKECPAHGFLARLDIPDEDMRELLEDERVDVLLRPPEHVISGERTSWPEPENFVYFSATHSDQRNEGAVEAQGTARDPVPGRMRAPGHPGGATGAFGVRRPAAAHGPPGGRRGREPAPGAAGDPPPRVGGRGAPHPGKRRAGVVQLAGSWASRTSRSPPNTAPRRSAGNPDAWSRGRACRLSRTASTPTADCCREEPPCDLVRARRRPAGRRPAGELREAERSVGQPEQPHRQREPVRSALRIARKRMSARRRLARSSTSLENTPHESRPSTVPRSWTMTSPI